MDKFFNQSPSNVLKHFHVSLDGLTTKAAQEALQNYGPNALSEGKKKSMVVVFLEQFKDLLVFILIAAAIISALSGNLESTIVIFAVIILNAILGTVQHFKAEKSLSSLKALSAPSAKVIRNGTKIEIPSSEVVPGDIIFLEAGDLIVADGRVIESYSLQVNESSLTGESESVNKTAEIIDRTEVALGDQINMVFSGSLVTYGRGIVLVTATGMQTEIGKIATLMNQTQQKKTPLQVNLDDFSKKLAMIILGICFIVFTLSIYRKIPVLDSLMFAVALAVAAIPEALSSIVTIVLALGTQKMAKQNAIMKELKAVESLGSISIICSDKTGTLTQNKMTTKKVYLNHTLVDGDTLDYTNPLERLLLQSAVLANDSTNQEGQEIGDPTEVALVNLGQKLGLSEISLRKDYPRLSEIPFDSDRKLMSTLHFIDGQYILFTKGAFDVLLDRTNTIATTEGIRELTLEDCNQINAANQSLSENGLRVLAFAYKVLPSEKLLTLEDETDYTFLGLISMIDPPREESKAAVADARLAGIKPIMITGDHKVTASAIAREIGILADSDIAVEGTTLDHMTDAELDEKLEHIAVYARVSPENKIRIVDAWQRKGKIVAMTGDGVNDAPALKKADIGIAMGITGTEVSKDAAAMILTDDNFATIVKAITNGRNVYTNIKNSIKFLLSGNTSGILAVLYTSICALPMPFAPVHLLFINLVTDSLPAIAIGMEEATDDLLHQKPRNPRASILSKDFLVRILVEGSIIGLFTLIAYHIGLTTSPQLASTMAFATLCLARLFHGFNCRGKQSIFKLGFASNKYSLWAFLAGFLFLNAVLFIPGLTYLFEVAPLTLSTTLTIYGLAFMPTVIIQIYKVLRERFLK
ncbi:MULTISPECIES: cation-translocating P-type ATPase [Zhenhengia]|uniref:P-type Ca(2+) transporter n=1 Tax=Zhenhengia yiwuensis TaxID=2763666 RepID=A0A926IBV1_9FIRM|nr:cation-translocating P-type ATPase [Zhenhengia yiwuensis]MBC8578062.1 cation-translocating P-type ATPase [Zhenhengia yiwuensis]MDY3369282.1 cation-translocating P-type ATPase [Zhenhengia yiwuensis]